MAIHWGLVLTSGFMKPAQIIFSLSMTRSLFPVFVVFYLVMVIYSKIEIDLTYLLISTVFKLDSL